MRQREIYSMRFDKMTKAELSDALKSEQARYDELKGRGLKLNMSRGIPSLEQLALRNFSTMSILKMPLQRTAPTVAITASHSACRS